MFDFITVALHGDFEFKGPYEFRPTRKRPASSTLPPLPPPSPPAARIGQNSKPAPPTRRRRPDPPAARSPTRPRQLQLRPRDLVSASAHDRAVKPQRQRPGPPAPLASSRCRQQQPNAVLLPPPLHHLLRAQVNSHPRPPRPTPAPTPWLAPSPLSLPSSSWSSRFCSPSPPHRARRGHSPIPPMVSISRSLWCPVFVQPLWEGWQLVTRGSRVSCSGRPARRVPAVAPGGRRCGRGPVREGRLVRVVRGKRVRRLRLLQRRRVPHHAAVRRLRFSSRLLLTLLSACD